MYPKWNTNTMLDQKPIWEAMSSQYAKGTCGSVKYTYPEECIGNV